MKLVTSALMRQIDRETIDNRSIPSEQLMDNAGHGIAVELLGDYLTSPEEAKVAIFCGRGNNGGDGFVVARHLARAGAAVTIYFLGPVDKLSADAKLNFDRAVGLDLDMVRIEAAEDLPESIACDLAVDAVLGTGFSGTPHGPALDMIHCMNNLDCPVVAIDLPSGLNADTGQFAGEVVVAETTFTLAQPKFGLYLSPGREVSGDVAIVPIGIPAEVINSFDLKIDLITHESVGDILPERKPDGHKGDFGRVLVVAGSTGMTGAASLAALASLRSGGGLTKLACPRTTLPILAAKLTEVMTQPLPDVAKRGALSLRGLGEIRQLTSAHDALVLGPGLGRHHETMELVRRLVARISLPTIIDADGLNAFEGHVKLLRDCQAPLVLTPHPGEFMRLTGKAAPEAIEERAEAAMQLAADLKAVVVLKGSPTLIAGEDNTCYLNPTGNHGMATGGSGDVLSGIIGTMLAQKVAPLEAAVAAVYIHGLAGDLAAEELTPRAMIAGDLINYLPDVFGLLD